MQETWVQSLGWEDLEKGMATSILILACRIPWKEEPGGLQFMKLQRVGHIFCFSGLACRPHSTLQVLKWGGSLEKGQDTGASRQGRRWTLSKRVILGLCQVQGADASAPQWHPHHVSPTSPRRRAKARAFLGHGILVGGSQSVWSRHGCWGISQSCGRHSGDNTVVLPSFCDGAVSVSCFLAALCGMWCVDSLTRDQTCAPLQWKCRVLTTGLPGKSLLSAF